MTKDYSHAISWIENHNSPDNYEDNEYEDWIFSNKEKFATPNLFNEPDFIEQLDKLWNEYHGIEDTDDLDTGIDLQEGGIRTIDNKRIVSSATISPSEAPVKVQSRTPIIITPIEEPKPIEQPIPVVIATPNNIPVQKKQSIFRRFLGFFRRRI